MSDTVKLIIEIPTGGAFECDIYTPICAEGFIRDEYNEKVAEAIKNGIPLDDVKEKIAKLRLVGYADALGKFAIASKAVMDVLDNIGKGDREC